MWLTADHGHSALPFKKNGSPPFSANKADLHQPAFCSSYCHPCLVIVPSFAVLTTNDRFPSIVLLCFSLLFHCGVVGFVFEKQTFLLLP